VSAVTAPSSGRLAVFTAEAAKLPAFARRDLLEAWSYRMAFFWDLAGLAFQAFIFFYIGKLVDPDVLPTFGSAKVSYLEFVTIGIAITMFVVLGLARTSAAFRKEQLMGTLEVLLMTPTAPTTIQLGLVAYDIIYMPLRTGIFFLVVALALGVGFDAGGVLPAAVTLLLFIPFVWGLGIALAAATLTFKKGGLTVALPLLTLTSGAYFPLSLFPDWLSALAELNPMAIAITTMRESLLGDAGWSDVDRALLVLAPSSALALTIGIACFRLAIRREQRRGTIGLY
jgi:ABC-2 type transport system permease protein